MLRFQLGSEEWESASVIPGIATTDIRDMGITHAATATMAVIHITERLTTVDGRTTIAAIELTSIGSIITTAIKRTGWCKVKKLAWSNSKPAFY